MRLRLNQREVMQLAAGAPLREELYFPGATTLTYALEPTADTKAHATYADGLICVVVPYADLKAWAQVDAVGLYLDFPAGAKALKVAIEKDLECLDGPAEERDPEAFPRKDSAPC